MQNVLFEFAITRHMYIHSARANFVSNQKKPFCSELPKRSASGVTLTVGLFLNELLKVFCFIFMKRAREKGV